MTDWGTVMQKGYDEETAAVLKAKLNSAFALKALEGVAQAAMQIPAVYEAGMPGLLRDVRNLEDRLRVIHEQAEREAQGMGL
jgi:hypothetical protein